MGDGRAFLLFDLGGVLIENTGPERFVAMMARPVGVPKLKRRWLASHIVRRFELGRSEPRVFARDLIDDWQLACSVEVFLDEFAAWLKGFQPGARELVNALRGRHRTGCLSNSNSVHWKKFDSFAGLFDVALSSHLIGLIKPDAACFAHAIEACGVDAGEILYFDDAPENIDGARKLGIDAVHVEGFEAVKRVLEERRIIDR